jgi:hypothetical protein
VALLYAQALRSLFIGSYDSQGYDGGIISRLHTGKLTNQLKLKLIYDRRSVGQSILGFGLPSGALDQIFVRRSPFDWSMDGRQSGYSRSWKEKNVFTL